MFVSKASIIRMTKYTRKSVSFQPYTATILCFNKVQPLLWDKGFAPHRNSSEFPFLLKRSVMPVATRVSADNEVYFTTLPAHLADDPVKLRLESRKRATRWEETEADGLSS